MLSMGMHYPREVPIARSKTRANPILPRGLSLCEIEALNTADGNPCHGQPRRLSADQKRGLNSDQQGLSHLGQCCKPSSRQSASGQTRPNRGRVSTANSKTASRYSVTSFKAPGAEHVNLQHVPTRKSSVDAGLCRQSSMEREEDSGLSTRCQNDNSLSQNDRLSTGSASSNSREHFGEVLSIDQKRLHLRRGLSREGRVGGGGGGEETYRPYPEPADAPLQSSYGYGYVYGYDESYNSYGEQSYRGHPHSSGQSSPTHTDGSRSLSISNGWTTGNTTERSSIYSFGEDAFDRKASQRVRQMFEHIDRILFEQHSGPQNLFTECKVWTTRFPHIRILGNQLLPPQDNGFQLVPGSPRTYNVDGLLHDVTEQDITASHGFNELSITGQHVAARVPPVESLAQLSENRDSDGEVYEKEEVFAQDGHVEDIIAVDYKTADEDSSDKVRQHRISTRQRHSGMPPMTPLASIKDNIGSSIFDLIWSEVISWLRDVLRKYAHVVQFAAVTDVDDHRSSAMALPIMQSPHQDILPPSRELSLINSSRLADRVPPMSAASQSPDGRGLDGLLTISTKALQSRERGVLGEQLTAEALERVLPLAIQGVRPGSSTTRYGMRPNSVKPQEGRLTSARMRTAVGRGRLAPLERAKTPSQDEDRQILQNEVLRGRKLTTLNDNRYSPTPPLTFHRNGALPPIGLDQEAPKKSHLTGRASSAVNDKEGRLPFKDRDRDKMAVGLETRPSTTHAMYRSDTPFSNRQTTTPLGFSSNRVAALSGLGKALAGGSNTNVLNLDVRGSGISPHVETDTPDIVDSEHLDEMIQSQWGASVYASGGGGGGIKRRLSVPIGHSFPPLRVRPGPGPVTSPRHSRSSTRASSATSDEASIQYGLSKVISATASPTAVDADYLHSSYLQT